MAGNVHPSAAKVNRKKTKYPHLCGIFFLNQKPKVMKNIRTEIIIDAPIATVWNILMNFDNYPNWNPFIHIKGNPVVGQHLENTIFLEGQKPQIFKPKIIDIQPNKLLRWEGNLLIKGLFDGVHSFQLAAINQDQTRLIHEENFKGILVGLVLKMIGKATEEGFEKMNLALKEQCEMALMEASV